MSAFDELDWIWVSITLPAASGKSLKSPDEA
jgi:hypothetical protein